jgi:hypothetical protein
MRRWLAALVVSCGGDDGTVPPDVLGDAVEVIVMTTGKPEMGRVVSFEGTDGTVKVETDADGRAVGAFRGPGTVTLENASGLGGQSILGVEAGEHLCFGACEPAAVPSQDVLNAELDVVPYAGASTYFFSYEGVEYDVAKTSTDRAWIRCPLPCDEPRDIYAIATDQDQQMVAWTSMANATFVEGQKVTLPGPWHPAESFTLTVRNAGSDAIQTTRTSPPSELRFGNNAPAVDSLTLTGSVANLTAMMRVTTNFERSYNVKQSVDAALPVAASYDLDASTELLPWITISSGTWTESAGQPYDAILISWQKSIGDAPMGSSVFAPAGTKIAIPGAIDGASIVLLERSDMTYKELRQRDHRFLTQRPKLPDGVTLRWSSASKPGPL